MKVITHDGTSLFNKIPMRHFFHQAGWKVVIEKAFGHKTYFFYVEKKGQITGILPLVHINSLLFGNTLVSLAPCVYGGVVASDNQSYIKLNEKACHLANELGVNCLEIRNKTQNIQTDLTKSSMCTSGKNWMLT
jgi:hypothetical protein